MAKVMVGVLPFIIGSALLAQMLFWQSHEFFGFYFKTQWYVFALQTGDGIFAVFSMLIRNAYIIGYVFGFIYTFLIISTVMSIFMVIVEDAYVTAKYATKYSWLIELEEIEKKQDDENKSEFRNNLDPGAISISVAGSDNDVRGSQDRPANFELRPPKNEQIPNLTKVTR